MAKIKISELSVGDWVRHTFYEDNLQIKRIDGESERLLVKKGLMSVSCHLDHFEPIPLTPEILEKNGFVKTWGRWYNSEALMEFEQYKDGWSRTINGGEYSVYFIKYVHQLQHALRLVGVGKEIELK